LKKISINLIIIINYIFILVLDQIILLIKNLSIMYKIERIRDFFFLAMNKVLKDTSLELFEKEIIFINDIKISANLSQAEFYLSSLDEKNYNLIFNSVNEKKKEIKYKFAQIIRNRVKKIPQISFQKSFFSKNAFNLEKIISENLQKIK
jgi:ribosome-binding factor A